MGPGRGTAVVGGQSIGTAVLGQFLDDAAGVVPIQIAVAALLGGMAGAVRHALAGRTGFAGLADAAGNRPAAAVAPGTAKIVQRLAGFRCT